MSDSRVLLRQRTEYAKLSKQALQLESLCLSQRKTLHDASALVEELCSVACAWAFDLGRGVPMMTDEEIRRTVNARIASETPSKKATP